MDFKEIVLNEVNAPKDILLSEMEHYERIRQKKERIGIPELNKIEQDLLNFEPKIKKVPIKDFRNPMKRGDSWMKFLKDEELKEIVGLTPKDLQYQKIRRTCYTRRYYSDPENLKLQYLRNKKYHEDKRIEKKEELKATLDIILENRRKSIEEKREKSNEHNKNAYHEKKKDPLFKEKEKERNKKWREENIAYRKINYTLKRKGLIPLTTKEVLRKEEILKKIENSPNLSVFRTAHYIDYNWVTSHGLSDEMFMVYPDYVKRKQYKSEKEDKLDEEAISLRKAKRNAEKCYAIKEYKKRFISSYNYIMERKLEDEIVKLFKQKENGADKA